MKHVLRFLLVPILVAVTPAVAAGEKLVPGSTAPALNPSKMLRGEVPDLKSERGCSIVVFWNSVEGPSRQAIAPMNRVFRELAPRGLQMILVSDEEEAAIAKLTKSGDGMPLGALASDQNGSAKNEWVVASKLDGLPRAFIVGRGGRILWMGSPLDEAFEATVRKAMGGRFDPASRSKLEPVIRAAQKCAEVRNFPEAYKHYGEAIDADPGLALDALAERYKTTLLKEGNAAAANEWIVDIAKKRYAGDQAALCEIVEMLVRDPEVKPRDLDAAEKVVEVMGAKTGVRSMAMQALVASARGDLRKAVDLQTDAWMAAVAADKSDLKRALDEYRAAARRQSNSAPAAGAGGPGGG